MSTSMYPFQSSSFFFFFLKYSSISILPIFLHSSFQHGSSNSTSWSDDSHSTDRVVSSIAFLWIVLVLNLCRQMQIIINYIWIIRIAFSHFISATIFVLSLLVQEPMKWIKYQAHQMSFVFFSCTRNCIRFHSPYILNNLHCLFASPLFHEPFYLQNLSRYNK